MAKPFVPSGGSSHASGGDTFWAFFPHFCAISSPWLNAGDVKLNILESSASQPIRHWCVSRRAARTGGAVASPEMPAASTGGAVVWVLPSCCLLRREHERLPEVEELGLAGADLVHLVHGRLKLWRYLLAFALPGLFLGGEVQDHGVRTVIVTHRDAADHVGTKFRPFVCVLGHQFPCPLRVGATALHDLHEASRVRVALQVESHIGAVLEGHAAVEQLLHLGPPFALLGAIAVAPGRLLGLETDNRDVPAVVSRSPGGPQPAVRTGPQLLHPPFGGRLHRLRIGHLAFDHLSEHVEPPSCALDYFYLSTLRPPHSGVNGTRPQPGKFLQQIRWRDTALEDSVVVQGPGAGNFCCDVNQVLGILLRCRSDVCSIDDRIPQLSSG